MHKRRKKLGCVIFGFFSLFAADQMGWDTD
jgi:hypothetical protein